MRRLGGTPTTRQRRTEILDRINAGYNINATGARADLAREMGISLRVMSSDLNALRKSQGPTSGIANVKRGRPKTKQDAPARNHPNAASDYAMGAVDARKQAAPDWSQLPSVAELAQHMPDLVDMSRAAMEGAMLSGLIGDGTLTGDAHMRILMASKIGVPPSIYHGFLAWQLERFKVHCETGTLSASEEMMAASRLTQRMEAALQLAQQQDAALPHLVQIRIDATQAPTAGVKPVGDVIEVE